MTRFLVHLASDTTRLQTVCGEPWQSWQQPDGPFVVVTARPQRGDELHQCQGCLRISMLLRERHVA